mgnify:CR=1 FL=1
MIENLKIRFVRKPHDLDEVLASIHGEWANRVEIQSRKALPPGSAKAARCSAPYLTRITSQPKAPKIFSIRPNRPSRTIPSRDCRL